MEKRSETGRETKTAPQKEAMQETNKANDYGRLSLKGKELQELEYALKRVFSAADLHQLVNGKAALEKQLRDIEKAIAQIDPEKAADRAKMAGAAKTVASIVISNVFFDGLLPLLDAPKKTGERVYSTEFERKQKLEQIREIASGLVKAYDGILNAFKEIEKGLPGDEYLAKFIMAAMVQAYDDTFFAELCGYLDNAESAAAIRQYGRYTDDICPVRNQIVEKAKKEPALAPLFEAIPAKKQKWLRGFADLKAVRKQCLEAKTMCAYTKGRAALEAKLDELAAFLDVSGVRAEAEKALDELKPVVYKKALDALDAKGTNIGVRITQIRNAKAEFGALERYGYRDSAAQRARAKDELGKVYEELCSKQASAKSKDECDIIIEYIKALGEYKDSAALLEATRQKKKEIEYNELLTKLSGENGLSEFQALRTDFEKLTGYKDSKEKAKFCRQEVDRLEKEEKEKERIAELKKKRIASCVLLAIALVGAVILLVREVIIPGVNYNNAAALRDAGKYEEAIAAFTALDGYKDSKEQITETKYQQAEALLEAKDYTGAAKIFIGLTGYKDVDNLIATDDQLSAAAYRAQFEVGKTVMFGSYAGEPIEWLVLEAKGDERVLISVKGLEAVQFNKSWYDGNNWSTSYVRSWLSGTFYNEAFSAEEKEKLINGVTGDKVYLLSVEEAKKYFANDNARMCAPTTHAVKNGAYQNSIYTVNGTGTCWWWLRSPGYSSNYAAIVDTNGSVNSVGYYVDCDFGCVRPVVVLRLS